MTPRYIARRIAFEELEKKATYRVEHAIARRVTRTDGSDERFVDERIQTVDERFHLIRIEGDLLACTRRKSSVEDGKPLQQLLLRRVKKCETPLNRRRKRAMSRCSERVLRN